MFLFIGTLGPSAGLSTHPGIVPTPTPVVNSPPLGLGMICLPFFPICFFVKYFYSKSKGLPFL